MDLLTDLYVLNAPRLFALSSSNLALCAGAVLIADFIQLSYVNKALSGSLTCTNAELAEAMEGARRVNKIIKELKLFARGGDERIEPVDRRNVVRGSLNIAVNELKRRAQVVLELEEIPRVLGSESQLGRVCLNLMINAAQSIAVGDAGQNRIVIRTRRRADGWVLLEVTDEVESLVGQGSLFRVVLPPHVGSAVQPPEVA